YGDRQAELRDEGFCRAAAPLGCRAHFLLVRTQPASRQGLREPCRNQGRLRCPCLHPACPQAACQDVDRRLNKPTVCIALTVKVCKSDCEGTAAGTRGNGEVAPIPVIRKTDVGAAANS